MLNPLPPNEKERLQSLESLRVLDTETERSFDDLTQLAAQLCGVPISTLSLIDGDRQWFKSKVGLEISETSRGAAFCTHTILGDDLFIVPNAAEDERFSDNPLVTGDPHIRFYAGAPLVTDQGHALGSLCVIDRIPRELRLEQREALQVLARQAMTMLELRRDSLALRRTNEELKAREESYRIVSESASDAIITIDEDSRIVFVNAAVEKVFGYLPEEMVGQHLSVIVPVRLREAHSAGMRRYMQTSQKHIPWNGITLPALRRDGEEIQIEISFGEYHQGSKRLFTAVIRDITERQQIEAKLRESESRYRFLAESVPQQVWTARADGQITYGNFRTIEYFGEETQSELFGINWTKIIHTDDLARMTKRWMHSIKTGEPYENEHRLRRGDGEYRWHLAQATPMFDENGAVVKWFGTNTDIHDRKLAEKAASETAEYRNLFENANDAILIFETETEIVIEVNEKACQLYGFDHDAFVGKSIKEISQDVRQGEIQLRELLKRGTNQSFETIQFRADGTPLNLFINSSIVEYRGRRVVLSINRDITERKRAEEQLRHNSLHDALTGLPNRVLFLEHLRHAIERNGTRGQKTFAVLFLDFDQFKIVNDSLGHMEGDRLLRLIAERLSDTLRPGDIVARLGGDEFTILLDDLGKSDDVIQIVKRIEDELKLPFNLSGGEIVISASIGIALSDADYTKPETMLRDADIAMYRAKAGGKARHQIFNQAMHERVSARLRMENELRQAIGREEFCVYYQPIINLQTDRLKGFEALVRWQHPDRGIVSPLEFIPIAEETGLIVPLGEWVIRESCRQLSIWQLENKREQPLTMSVNLSCRQFTQNDLVERIERIVGETKIEVGTLRLEVTESHLMEDSEAAIAVMNRLRALDIKLSIDDFGTGYSSLSYLHRLPVNYLKIDRSFVSQMQIKSENREIVRTITLLAKNLHLEVIAEGIETREQADYLKSLGCEFGQGFLYSKPVERQQAGALIGNSFANRSASIKSSALIFELVNEANH